MLAAGYGAFFAKRLNWLYSLLATGIVFYMAVAIPSWYREPTSQARADVLDRMHQLQTLADTWGNQHGHYPMTREEVSDAEVSLAMLPVVPDSRFARLGRSIPIEIAVTGNAHGALLKAEQPGVLNYAVDATGTHYWITGTVLPRPVSAEAVLLSESAPGPLVLEGKLEPPPPAPPAAPTKTPPAKK